MSHTAIGCVFIHRLPPTTRKPEFPQRMYTLSMGKILHFFWNATRGHRLAPWRSPYLRWRMETYSGLKMDKIGFLEFWGFFFRERAQLMRFLRWTAEMENYARPKPKNP
jgi:hypothetical protein